MTSRDHYRNGESIFDKVMQNTIEFEEILKLICLLTHRNKQNTSAGTPVIQKSIKRGL